LIFDFFFFLEILILQHQLQS